MCMSSSDIRRSKVKSTHKVKSTQKGRFLLCTFQVNLKKDTNSASRTYGMYFGEAESKEPLNLNGFANLHRRGLGATDKRGRTRTEKKKSVRVRCIKK